MKDLLKSLSDGDNILITGGAGVGKTYHTNKIIEKLKQKNVKFAVCAMTGLASQHLHFGITLHRFLQTGMAQRPEDFDDLTDSMFFQENLKTICNVETIIIDEVSMMRADYLELMDLVLKEARIFRNIQNKNLFDQKELMPFGGYQIIMVGDFCQLPPVIKEKEVVKHRWIFQHKTFIEAKFRVYNLTETKRTSDPFFANSLNKIRVGFFDEDVLSMLKDRANAVLNGEATVLMSRVNAVRDYNEERLKHHSGDSIKLYGNFSIREDIRENESLIRRLYRMAITESGLEKLIELKVGCKVMILANSSVMNYSNGSQGTLLGTLFFDELSNIFKSRTGHEYYLDYKHFGECLHVLLDSGEDVVVPKKAFPMYSNQVDSNGKRIIDVTYYQYPITLGYAISAHKSQGMSLDHVIFDCSKIFTEGQFYVGLSRARSLQGLSLLNFHPSYIRADQDAVEFYLKISGREQGEVYVH